MNDLFLQIFLLLVSTIFGIVITLKDKAGQRKLLRLFSYALITVIVLWIGYTLYYKFFSGRVEIVSPYNNDGVTIVQTPEQKKNNEGTFNVYGKFANISINEHSQIFLVATNPTRDVWYVFSAIDNPNGTWNLDVFAEYFIVGTKYRLKAIVCDPALVKQNKKPDGSIQVPNLGVLHPQIQSNEILVTVANIVEKH